jgi:hypothetical protein
MRTFAEIAAGAFALVFVAAAVGKVDSWGPWSRLTEEIPGPGVLGRVVRIAVPAAEGAIVVLSLASPVIGLAAGAIILGGFALAVWTLARQLAGRECNCFGAIAPATISSRLASRNIALAILAAAGWYAARRESLQAMSFSKVLVTALLGAIALMGFQFRQLRQAARPASPTLKEGE